MINILEIDKQPEQKEKDYEWNDKKYYEVPNVIGMTKSEAKKYLSNFEIDFVGDGEIVIEQTPLANTRYYETGTIKLLMGNK